MATVSPNGSILQGTFAVPSNYPSGVTQNVNMQPMNAAYHLDQNYSGETQQQKDEDE